MNVAPLTDWIGRTDDAEDIASSGCLARLAATLDHVDPPWRARELPPLGHWCCFLPQTRQHDLAGDGHAHRGGFLPPVPLPRRMWAGGSFTFRAAIPVGAPIRRHSTVASITPRSGRSGHLVFVEIVHEVFVEGALAVREQQDIVYRELPKEVVPTERSDRGIGSPGERSLAPLGMTGDAPLGTTPAAWRREIRPDPVLLFRYSAVTFNAHRIHYDREYCREMEGYPGLVVHGPLTATLLMDLFLRHHPGAPVTAFRFRAHRPLFDIHPFTICGAPHGGGARLWALDHSGEVAMSAELEVAP
jgi:3-methylfumaryl-CoA hydratase